LITIDTIVMIVVLFLSSGGTSRRHVYPAIISIEPAIITRRSIVV